MKKFILFISVFILNFWVIQVQAHGGRISILEVNGEAARANVIADDIPNSSLKVALDLAPKPVIVNQPADFLVDTSLFFGAPSPSSYTWDFGDGTNPVTGMKAQHEFGKPGTYILTLKENASSPNPTTTMEIIVAPNKEYTVPEAKITANGKAITDILLDYVEVIPGGTVKFDAGQSIGDIRTYQWDFGDKTTGEGKTVSHTYKKDTVFPAYALLRVTDANGITHDAAASVDTPLGDPSPIENLMDMIRGFFANLFHTSS